jgi:D-xylonolactonase
MKLHQPECLWDVGAHLGEGPIWHAATRSVYFVDIKGHQIHRCAHDGTQRRSWAAPAQVSFIVPLEGGGFACGMPDGVYRFSEVDGSFTLLREVERDLPSNRFNDGYVDAQGTLWFGSMDDGEASLTGSLYHLDSKGEVRAADSGYIITNGPAMSPDGRVLYHTDTLEKVVYAFDVGPGATLSRKRVFVRITGAGHPDGMAVDAEGHVWIGIFRGARIERYNPDGVLVDTVPFPCSNITKLAFGGDDGCTAYVTTAWKGLSVEERAREPLAGALFTFRTAAPGLPQHTFSSGDPA